MKASYSKKCVSHKLKLYQLFRSRPPYAIQVKITTVTLQGVLYKLEIYQLFRSFPLWAIQVR